MRRTRSTAAWLPDNCSRLVDSLKQTVDASNFPTIVRIQEIHPASFMHHIVLTDRDFKSESHLPVKFHDFVYFFTDIKVSTVSQGKVGT